MNILKKIVIAIGCSLFCGTIAIASDLQSELPNTSVEQEYRYNSGQIDIVDNKDNTYTVTITGVILSEGIKAVQFPVWSALNGQDDLKWYQAQKIDESTYCCTVDLRNHIGLGLYFVHAYGIDMNNNRTFLTSTEMEVAQPQIQNITITEKNFEQGLYHVKVTGLSGTTLVNSVKIAVWSEDKGQDDLKWYKAQKEDDGDYYIDLDIKKHKYSRGIYNIHVYIDNVTGMTSFAGKTTTNVMPRFDKLSVETENDIAYTVRLTGLHVPAGVKEVQFPVWSSLDGQDDLKWYKAQKVNEDIYECTIDVKNHYGLGKYNVHAYGIDMNNKRFYLTSSEFEAIQPQINEITISEENSDKGLFRVKVTGLGEYNSVKNVKIPVWSGNAGQDDLVWYEAQKDSKGDYYADINVEKHKYTMGMYQVHVYINDITGRSSFAGKTTFDIGISYDTLSIKTEDDRSYIITLSGLQVPAKIKEIKFPVWSDNAGQDDLKWHTAEKQADGTWKCEMPLSMHKGLGEYKVHAYVLFPNGTKQFVGETTFEVNSPVINDIAASITDTEKGKIQVELSGIEEGNLIQKIQVPIWSDQKQGDIVWYTAEKKTDGTYIVSTDISKHAYNCKLYEVHVYITDITGVRSFAGKTTCDLSPECDSLEVVDIDGKEKTYKIKLSGLHVPYDAQKVQFAVWGEEKGQDDLKWYTASKEDDSTYTYTFSINNHKELGEYQVHAYCTTINGKKEFVSETTCSVVTQAKAASVEVSEINGTAGTFRVTVKGVFAPSGVDKVQIPMWCSSNQNDLKWYTALEVAEGEYTAVMDVKNHKYYFGTYQIHAYATMGNGIRNFMIKTTADIQPVNYIYNLNKSNTQREVGILGATGTRVRFPTWSNTNGQDDLIWYEGKNCGNGKWNVVIDSAKHKSAGTYTTHVYVTEDGTEKYVGAMNYSLQKIPQDMYSMWLKANMYSSSTNYIILVNRNTHKVGIYQGYRGNWNCVKYWSCADGKASTPTVSGVFRVGSKGYYFNSGIYRCYWWTQFYGDYLFHSVLYSHSGVLMDGRVGVALSHGCVRLQIDNAKWIYDHIPSGTTVVVY